MCGYLALRRGKLLQSGLAALHPRVVQQDHVGRTIVLARIEIRRWRDIGDNERVRLKNRLQERHGPEHTGAWRWKRGNIHRHRSKKQAWKKVASIAITYPQEDEGPELRAGQPAEF